MADGITAGFEPETFLWLEFHRPDRSVRIWYAWTAGGQPLGDRIDHLAMAAGYDAADWLHIADRHEQTSTRGRVKIKAYALRPVLADVQSGVRATQERHDSLLRVLSMATEATGRPCTQLPRWLGFGPAPTARQD